MSDYLVVAYACDPTTPSEPTIGWSFVWSAASTLRAGDTLHLLTNTYSAHQIASHGAAWPGAGTVVLHAVPWRWFSSYFSRPSVGLRARIGYLQWYISARRYLNRANWRDRIRVAMHFTFATEMLPTPISVLPSMSFKAWGPVGSEGDPRVALIGGVTVRGIIAASTQLLRDVVSSLALRAFGRRIDLVVAQSEGVANKARRLRFDTWVFPNLILPMDAVLAAARSPLARRSDDSHDEGFVNVLCVGHVIPRKRLDLAIRCLAVKEGHGLRLTIVGQVPGGGLGDLPDLAQSLGVESRVQFLASLSREQVLTEMMRADVLFQPSIREGASGVIGEAISVGLPVVCFKGTGSSGLIDASSASGILLEARQTKVADIARALAAARDLPRTPRAIFGMDRFSDLMRSMLQYGTEMGATERARRTCGGGHGVRPPAARSMRRR